MARPQLRPLACGFTAEVDSTSEVQWNTVLQDFLDANIYQTAQYASVTCGRRNSSHVILKQNDRIVALAQARIAKIPLLNAGIAYVHWGPVWRRREGGDDVEAFRQAVRALRNEFVCRRGLVIRLFPILYNFDSPCFSRILEEEGFVPLHGQALGRTILMDLKPPLGGLREGMKAHWKRELKVAEKQRLELVEGTGDELFEAFIGIYKEMVRRKRFVEPNDIYQFRRIQSQLPEPLKMKIMLCKIGDEITSGMISSAIGDTAVYLFGATSTGGLKSRGSYFLQWKMLSKLRNHGVANYNLNGINSEKNPGTYKFKSDLAGANGREANYLGRFDARDGSLSRFCVGCGEWLRLFYRALRELPKTARNLQAPPKAAEQK